MPNGRNSASAGVGFAEITKRDVLTARLCLNGREVEIVV